MRENDSIGARIDAWLPHLVYKIYELGKHGVATMYTPSDGKLLHTIELQSKKNLAPQLP